MASLNQSQLEVVSILEGTLSADTNVRQSSEAKLTQLSSSIEFNLPLLLSSLLLVHPSICPLHLQQSAALALRLIVKQRWSLYFSESFIGYPPNNSPLPSEFKPEIRNNLLQALAHQDRKVRLAVAYTTATICGAEWPDEMPQLIPTIKDYLQKHDSNAKHGSLALLTDFVGRDMDENQLMNVARELLPSLERVVGDERLSPHLRSRPILIFRNLLHTLFMVREEYPEASKTAADEMLPRWLGAMQGLVGNLDSLHRLGSGNAEEKDWEYLAVLNECWKTLKIATHFRAHFKPYLVSLGSAALASSTAILPAFSAYYLSSDSGPTFEAAEGDQDVSATITDLACSILSFLSEASRSNRLSPIYLDASSSSPSPAFSTLITTLLSFSRITSKQHESWLEDPNLFVTDTEESTDAFGYDLRIASIDTLSEFLEAYPKQTLSSLASSVQVLVSESRDLKSRGMKGWWKNEESALACLGGTSESVLEILEAEGGSGTGSSLDLNGIFQHVVMPNLSNETPALLRGRAFIFASQYAASMPEDLAKGLLEEAVKTMEGSDGNHVNSETVEGMEQEEGVLIRLAGMRAVKNFHRHLPAALLRPLAPRIIASLGPLLSQTSEDTLVLILETVQAVSVEDELTPPEVYSNVVRAALEAWGPHAEDPILLSVISDLLESLSSHKLDSVSSSVLSTSFPLLCSVIESTLSQSRSTSSKEEPSPLIEASVELIAALLTGAKQEVVQGVNAVGSVCPTIMSLMMNTEDRDVLQYGLQSLTLLVRKDCQTLLAWHSSDSTPSLHLICSILSRLLLPPSSSSASSETLAAETETGGLAIGDLLIALLRKAANELLPVLPDLLRAMVQRLNTAQTASFSQSLILPFAYLMHEQSSVVLDLLEATSLEVKVEEGGQTQTTTKSGLEVFVRKWVVDSETFQGFWAQRVSIIALIKLLESRRPVLDTIIVPGDLIPDTSNIIRTRSRAKNTPHKFTQIPLPAKILKLLVKEYETAQRGPPSGAGLGLGGDGARTPETDDEDGEWDDEDDGKPSNQRSGEMAFLSDLLGPGGVEDLMADDMDLFNAPEDPELKDDPIWSMDMKSYLSNFFRVQAAEPDVASRIGPYLTEDESKKLRAAVA